MNKFKQLPLLLKIIVIFFVISLCWNFIAVIANLLSNIPQNNSNPYYVLGYKTGYFISRMIQNALFLILTIGIINKKKWVIKATIITFVYSIIYDGYSFAQGFSSGAKLQISLKLIVISYIIITIQYLILFYIIIKKKNRETYIN